MCLKVSRYSTRENVPPKPLRIFSLFSVIIAINYIHIIEYCNINQSFMYLLWKLNYKIILSLSIYSRLTSQLLYLSFRNTNLIKAVSHKSPLHVELYPTLTENYKVVLSIPMRTGCKIFEPQSNLNGTSHMLFNY